MNDDTLQQAQQIQRTAEDMIREYGLINLTRAGLCERAGVPDGSFAHIVGCTFSEFVENLRDLNIPDPEGCKAVKSRINPALRRGHILDTAVGLAKEHGYRFITRGMVAEAAGVSGSLVSLYFNMNQLRENIMELAVMRQIPEIIAQGLLNQDIIALSVSPELKAKAAEIITG